MGKHLNLSQRIEIESKLNEGKSFRQIANIIGKPHTTISREIESRRIFKKGNSFNSLNMKCEKTEKAPYVCNSCPSRKVRYKKRIRNKEKITKDTKIRINRTYNDFKDYVKNYNDNNFNINIVEMDTVEGTKGESVLLTLLWRQANFMLTYKLESKDAESVSNFFHRLKKLLGYEKFHILFPIILTDNGVEFSKPDVIEYNGNHVYKTKLFYCDPGASGQKGKIENNHEYIRRFIPKGKTFDEYTQNDINLMLNHINSVKRDSLSGDNPYTLMKNFLPNEIIDLFDIEEIKQKDIILKNKLFDYKRKDSPKPRLPKKQAKYQTIITDI